jgi:hypothetical protein
MAKKTKRKASKHSAKKVAKKKAIHKTPKKSTKKRKVASGRLPGGPSNLPGWVERDDGSMRPPAPLQAGDDEP